MSMTLSEALKELESYGDPTIKNIYLNHGMREPLFGVRVGDMKKIVKKIKKDHDLSMALYATGNSDAMYLAGLIADETVISRDDLQKWVSGAYNHGIGEYTVAWVAAETDFGFELGLEWIYSEDELIATAGWSTLANYAAVKADEQLDIDKFSELLGHVKVNIHQAPNRVRYTMNGFVIAIGSYVISLNQQAREVAESIGKVEVFMGNTACKVPLALDYIKKVESKGRLGKKRKQARC